MKNERVAPEGREERVAPEGRERKLRPSGYAARFYELIYGFSHPFYDLLVGWGLLPLGGEAAFRRQIVGWLELAPQKVEPKARLSGPTHPDYESVAMRNGLLVDRQRVVSLCCGTGTTERAILELHPGVRLTGVDLGSGQLARARRKDPTGGVDYRLGDAAATGLPDAAFDRVAIVMALHEMPRPARLAVLGEARRLCRPDGLVLAVEHGHPPRFVHRLLQNLWWFYWLPGNPEVATTRDLNASGLDREMCQVGLEIVARHASRMEWVVGFAGRPATRDAATESPRQG